MVYTRVPLEVAADWATLSMRTMFDQDCKADVELQTEGFQKRKFGDLLWKTAFVMDLRGRKKHINE